MYHWDIRHMKQGENSPCNAVHDIATGGFHHNVTHKGGGKLSVVRKQVAELFQLGFIGQLSERSR